MNETIKSWIINISDDYIIQWANKGILRRGRKLAEKSRQENIDMGECITGCLEAHRQTIEGAGFQLLKCSCPAAGPCHHLAAFVLLLKEVLADTPPSCDLPMDGAQEAETPDMPPPWLIPDPEEREKRLGKARIRRAGRLMMRAVPVALDEDDTGLTAVIRETKEHTVRVPRHGGLDASLCSCGAAKCVHRTLAVLTACQIQGLFEPEDRDDDILSPLQKKAVTEIETWLTRLVIQGVNHTSASLIDSGEALATLTRQADMPKIAGQLKAVCQWLADEKAGAAHVKPEALRFSLARISAHLTALQSTPMPQPFLKLAGVHTRRYDEVRNLLLIGAGAEIWESAGGYRGFTLYLYSPEQKLWYRRTQARPAAYAEADNWNPETAFLHARWAAWPAYRDIPGHEIRLSTGWVSPDRRISGRDGTRISEASPLEDAAALPVCETFQNLARIYADFLSIALFSEDSCMPALISFQRSDPPSFDPYRQVWSQRLFDHNGHAVRLRLDAGPHTRTAVKTLAESMASGGQVIFGMLSQTDGELSLRPVSMMQAAGPVQWRHLTIKEKGHVRRA